MVEKYSRYKKGGTTDSSGFWTRKTYTKSYDDMNLTITKKYHRRPELLAKDIYGSEEVMWFVLQYNSIVDVHTEFVEGASISLPTPIRFVAGMI